ncbi:MAG TPA: LON peptidase substrate-binding domain-containing protein [Candidatus Limnocylindrales bacterium]|nr:LON peptidase substrate-binding domain-containing protein [Candidatus Limnocylindrales bacterium]
MELPLFPLNTVLCPGIALPLHVFEDRYRAMIRHCLEASSPFGIVLIRHGREVGTGAISFTGIGTIAEIRDAGAYDDGRYDLLVVGTRRFEIRRVLSGKRPYLVAEVDVLTETVGDDEVAHRLAMTATRRFVTYLELLQPRSGETAEEIDVRVEVETADDDDSGEATAADPEAASEAPTGDGGKTRRVAIPDDPTVLSYLLAGILQIEAPRRQALLEAETTERRLRTLLALIDRENLLLRQRLRFFRPDDRMAGPRRS